MPGGISRLVVSCFVGQLCCAVTVMDIACAQAPLEHVNIRLNFLPGAEHSFLYLAKQKGWFAAEGLDVDIIPGQGSTVAVKTVGSGEDQFAVADTASVARGWEAGVPLVYVAMLLKHTPGAVFSVPDKNIHTLQDLCGKRVGVNLKSTTAQQYHAMIKVAKLDCSIEEVPLNSGGSKEVLSDAVDAAVNFSYTDALRVKLKVGGVNVIPAKDYFDFFSLGIITNKSLLEQKPDVVRKFVAVSLKGLSYVFDHEDEGLAAFLQVNPEADQAYEKAKLEMFKSLVTEGGKDQATLGLQSLSGWNASLKTLNDIDITKSVVDADGKFLNVN